MRMKMSNRDRYRSAICSAVLVLLCAAPLGAVESLAGQSQLLCVPVQATVCAETGECVVDLPWNVNLPHFIEVDLDARVLRTTPASGENRMSPIEHLARVGDTIVFHGFEMDRAFSWVISESTGHVTAAIALDGMAVSVFGVCSPRSSAVEEADGGEVRQ